MLCRKVQDLDGYNKKKYVYKLLYVHLLGYDVEFGHMEAVNLITSDTYSEKSVVRNPRFMAPLLYSLTNLRASHCAVACTRRRLDKASPSFSGLCRCLAAAERER